MSHLAGTRNAFAVPSSDVRAPTTWSQCLEFLHELGDALVRVGQVGVGPHDDAAPGGAGADLRALPEPRFSGKRMSRMPVDGRELVGGAVGRAVVDDDDLVRVRRCVEGGRMRSISVRA